MHPCCQGIVEDLHWEHIGLSPSQFTRTTIYEMRLTVFNKNPTCIISGASSWMWVVGDHSREPQDEMNFLVKVKVNTSVIGSPSWTFCGSTRPLTLHAPETLSLTGYQKTPSSLEESSPWKLHRLSLASECTNLGSGSEETRGQTLQLCLERRASTCLQNVV